MKKIAAVFVIALIVLTSCATPKPYYETRIGKKKQKYYNDLQYGKSNNPKRSF